MASQWLINRNGVQSGPFSSTQLRELASSGQIGPGDLLWKPGMKEWVAARSAKGLFVEAASRPTPSAPAAAATANTEMPDNGKQPSSFKAGRIALLIGVLFAAYFFRDSLPARIGRAERANEVRQDRAASRPEHAKADRPKAAETREAASQRPTRSWLWGQRPTRFELLSMLQDYSDESVKMNGRFFLDRNPPFGRVEGDCVETFLKEFRNPDEDISALPNAPTLKDSHRWWVYECSDGLLRFRVQLGPQLGSRSFSMLLDAKENIPK